MASFGSYSDAGPQGGRDASNEFTRLSQAVGKNIQTITQNVASVQRMINQIGTQQDSTQLRDKLHQIQHYTNQLSKDTNRYLHDLSHLPQPSLQSEQRQRKMQKERLMNEFSQALKNFQTEQRHAADKEKASVARARASSGYSHDPFFDDGKGSNDVFSDAPRIPPPGQSMSQQQQQEQALQIEQDVDLDMLQERESAIKQLESDIMDVNQIFKDLGMLVHEQGEVVDSIEANVESAAIHVEQGRDQLQKAKDYQSKARRKKFICVIILLVVLTVIGVIIGVSVKN